MTNMRTVCLILLVVPVLATQISCRGQRDADMAFHNDADLARLEHLEYWTGLVEEYEEATGHYPFATELNSQDAIALVRIANKEQLQYFDTSSSEYIAGLDNNYNGRFQEFGINDFVAELERGLGRPIDEKYDIQYVPTGSPVWYNYFVTSKGYLVWVTCISCGVTPISTLLFDGYTPTVNITSPGMKDSVTKALTRKEMLTHPIYLEWKRREFVKEGFVRDREQRHYNDSKMNQ